MTKSEIVALLNRSDKAVVHGLIAIYKLQTPQEQTDLATQELNGIGFNGVDAPLLTSFARQYLSKGWLSPKQMMLARKKIVKYSGQLEVISKGH